MFIVGVLIHTRPELSQDALEGVLDELKANAEKAGVELNTDKFSVADIAYSFTIALICFGLFLCAISVLGLIGVKYSLKPILIVVSRFLSLILP